MMKVILQEDVPNLGVVGDLVTVRDGYGRNYLIPSGRAVFASVRSISELEHQKRLAAHRRKEATAQAEINRRRIENLSVCITAKVAPPAMSDEGHPIIEKLQKLFGSITTRDLTRVLADSDVKVDHRRVTLNEPVRTVGKYIATIRLDGGISASLPFWVIPEGASGDIESEKKRVEAAQEAYRKEREAALAAEKAALAAAEKERLRQIEAKKAADEAKAKEAPADQMASEE